MEAKVDVRNLQLLNDRINQCIEALNQVRLSVHGLAHSSFIPGMVPGYGQTYGIVPSFGQQFGFGAPTPGTVGLGHTTAFAPPVPFYGAAPLQLVPQVPTGPIAAPWIGPLGLSHTGAEAIEAARLSDPFWAARMLQTFP